MQVRWDFGYLSVCSLGHTLNGHPCTVLDTYLFLASDTFRQVAQQGQTKMIHNDIKANINIFEQHLGNTCILSCLQQYTTKHMFDHSLQIYARKCMQHD